MKRGDKVLIKAEIVGITEADNPIIKTEGGIKMLVKKSDVAEYNSFAEWVAEEIFADKWEYNKDAFAEIACRKLAKLGIVKKDGDKWVLVKGVSE